MYDSNHCCHCGSDVNRVPISPCQTFGSVKKVLGATYGLSMTFNPSSWARFTTAAISSSDGVSTRLLPSLPVEEASRRICVDSIVSWYTATFRDSQFAPVLLRLS